MIAGIGTNEISITLDSNPSTGYSWAYLLDSENSIMIESEYLDNSIVQSPGRGGTERFVIRALAEGKTTLSLFYGRHAYMGFSDTDENGLDKDPLYVLTLEITVSKG